MPRSRFSLWQTISGSISVNSIHPEIDINGSQQQDGGYENQEGGHNLFEENVVSTTVSSKFKSNKFLVRDNRFIHVQQYIPSQYCDPNSFGCPAVLFFIHGVGGSSKIWDSQVQHFALLGYEVVAFDLLGHGLSSAPQGFRPYHFEELALDVLYIFDRFCKRRNVVIGHSYGTSFCILLSNERCNLVSKMILLSGGGPTTLLPDKCSVFSLPKHVFCLIQPLLLRLFRRRAFHRKTSLDIRNKVTAFNVSAHVLKAIMQGQHWSACDEQFHGDLTVPALLIYGSSDRFVTLSEELHMKETMYSSKLEVIENAGHMVMIEAPSEVNDAIEEFLNRDASTKLREVTSDDAVIWIPHTSKKSSSSSDVILLPNALPKGRTSRFQIKTNEKNLNESVVQTKVNKGNSVKSRPSSSRSQTKVMY